MSSLIQGSAIYCLNLTTFHEAPSKLTFSTVLSRWNIKITQIMCDEIAQFPKESNCGRRNDNGIKGIFERALLKRSAVVVSGNAVENEKTADVNIDIISVIVII